MSTYSDTGYTSEKEGVAGSFERALMILLATIAICTVGRLSASVFTYAQPQPDPVGSVLASMAALLILAFVSYSNPYSYHWCSSIFLE